MLKALVEHIQKTAQPQVVEIEGSSFVINGNGDAIEIHPDPRLPGYPAPEQPGRAGEAGTDGGLRARETIKDFLEDELAEKLENGQVLIAL